jgi:hypothetical protein
MSDESNKCGCGHDHDGSCEEHDNQHEENDGCGCGSDGCAGGCEGGCNGGGCEGGVIYITEEEKDFLERLGRLAFMPLARFIMRSSKSEHMESVGLEPVYLQDKNDSMETVKQIGAVLRSLEDKYLISLDYDMPLLNYNYSIYEESELYQLFCRTVRDGAKQGGFLFDLAELERGSMALTTLGQDALDSLE